MAGSVAYTKASDRDNRLFGVGGFYQLHPNIQVPADVVQFREEQLLTGVNDGVAAVMEVLSTI